MISRSWRPEDREDFFDGDPAIFFKTRLPLVILLTIALMLLTHVVASAQPCVVSPTVLYPLPTGTGTTPAAHDLVVAGNNLYGPSQWGVFRALITNPANPSGLQLFGVGQTPPWTGPIPIKCDCFAAWRAFDVVTDGTNTRIIGSWSPFSQGGNPPPGPVFSGLAGQLLSANSLAMVFGQQIGLPNLPRTGGRIAALQVGGKFYGYFPVEGQGVYYADITAPTGNAAWQNGIASQYSISWGGGSGGASPRLRAANGLLVGSTPDLRLHIGTVGSDGSVTEVASTPDAADPVNLDIGVINGRTFIFSAEDLSGLRVYEYVASPPTLSFSGSINGRFKLVRFHSGVLFGHRLDPSGKSFIDIYNTAWLTGGGAPILGASLPTLGATGTTFLAYGFDAAVDAQNAYVYREAAPSGSIVTLTEEGSVVTSVPKRVGAAGPYAVGQSIEQSLAETTVSLPCLQSNSPTPTPTPTGSIQPTVTPPPGGNPYAQQIEAISKAGITKGCGNDDFCPTRTMTRQEVAAWLAKAMGYPLLPCVGIYKDVPCPIPGLKAVQP